MKSKSTEPSSHVIIGEPLNDSQTLIDDALSEIGMGSYQWKLFFLCGLGWAADNMFIQGITDILPQVTKEFNITGAAAGLPSTCTTVGMMVGGTFWGFFSDIYGRKPVFLITLLITCIFGLAAAFAFNAMSLYSFVFLMGFGLGGNLPVDGALFLEFTPKERHSLLTLMSLFWPVGQVIAASFAWPIMPRFSCESATDCPLQSNMGWRYVQGALGLLALVMFFLRYFFFQIYESPKFLMSQKKYAEAAQVLETLAKMNGKSLHIDRIALEQSHCAPSKSKISKQLAPLFTKDMRRTTLFVWLIWTLVAFGYVMFNAFLPFFLEGESIADTYVSVFIFSACGIPGSLAATFLVDTVIGRKGALSISTIGTGLSLFLFTRFTGVTQTVISCFTAALQNAMYGVIYSYSPEVFPVEARGTGVGIASSLGRISGSIAPLVTGSLIAQLEVPLYLSSGIFLLTGIIMLMLPIETRTIK
jgi:MFS family permease